MPRASKETSSQVVALQQWHKFNLTDKNYAARLCLYIHQQGPTQEPTAITL